MSSGRPNRFDLLLAPKLGGEDRHAAGETEQQQNENEENLIRQPQRGNGSLAQLPYHDDIDHVERSIDELLK